MLYKKKKKKAGGDGGGHCLKLVTIDMVNFTYLKIASGNC